MTDTTPNLGMPYILPSQAQKHVTHNKALQIIDAIASTSVKDALETPPSSPAEGDIYLVGSSPTGAWTGKAGKLAMLIDGAWLYLAPREGWRAWFAADGVFKRFDGTEWVNPFSTLVVDKLGVGAAPDDTNHLSVAADASLFSHAGSSHRMTLNKAAIADTATLLFQSDWSGRAEIGLAGSDMLQFKTSADGATWNVGLEVDGDGIVRTPARPVISATLAGSTIAPTAGDEIGFDTLTLSQGDFAFGAAAAGGNGSVLTVPVSGLYAVSLRAAMSSTTAAALTLAANGVATRLAIRSNAAIASTQSFTAYGILSLAAGDRLSLTVTGTASLSVGQNLELSLHML